MNDNKKIAQKLNKILKADNCDAMLDKTPSAVTRYVLGNTWVEIDWCLKDGICMTMSTMNAWYEGRVKNIHEKSKKVRLTDVLPHLNDEALESVTNAMNYLSDSIVNAE